MAWKAYNSVNGQILGEVSDASGARPVDYLTDALGSVVATVSKGTLQNTYRWAGYGQQVHKTGASPDPKFLWVGAWGYRASGSLVYVRERSLATTSSVWLSVDALWPKQSKYTYCNQNPSSRVDYFGLKPTNLANCPKDILDAIAGACKKLKANKDTNKKKIADCMKKNGFGDPSKVLDCILARCDSPSSCVFCSNGKLTDFPKGWPTECLYPFPCAGPTGATGGTYDMLDKPKVVPVPGQTYCTLLGPNPCETALDKLFPKCDTIHVICLNHLGQPRDTVAGLTWLHELSHGCTRLAHGSPPKGKKDFINQLECCICLTLYDAKTCKKTKSC